MRSYETWMRIGDRVAERAAKTGVSAEKVLWWRDRYRGTLRAINDGGYTTEQAMNAMASLLTSWDEEA